MASRRLPIRYEPRATSRAIDDGSEHESSRGGASTNPLNEEPARHAAVEVRDILSIDEMRVTEDIQREVWGLADIDIVPAAQMKAAVHAGGQVAGAFEDGIMVGFAYGIVAAPYWPGVSGMGLHSHMVAVRERGRQRGVGRELKWFQRLWCLEHGMKWSTWTFDPLQARNAKLNFAHLGVVSHEYQIDFYGVMAGPLGSDASDRLVALWLLDSEVVSHHATAWRDGRRSEPLATAAAPSTARDLWLLREEDVATSGSDITTSNSLEAVLADGNPDVRLRVAAPHDVGALKRNQAAVVARWRDSMRASIIPALASGYAVVGFIDGAYVLEKT